MNACADPAPADDIDRFFEVSLDLLIIRDLEGRIVKASESWRALGWSPQDLVGRRTLSLVHPDDMPHTLLSVVEVEERAVGAPVSGCINRYRRRDGGYVTVEWRAQRMGDRIYAVARDVTQRLADEQALIAAKQEAKEANRAKSDFLANMSHEIRTPLNGVIGIVDALSRTPLSPDQAEMVELVRSSGEMLERLVSDILDVSKIEAGQLVIETQPFDLDEALLGPLDLMRMRAEDKGLAFRVRRDATARGRFIGDSTRLRQVFGNLLANAVKFTAEGSVTVDIAVAHADDGQALMTFEVIDTGVGFDADHAARLFQRFSQADASITRRFGGTGLGLSICRALTGLMGGTISADSTPGRGSRFRVELPLARATEAAPVRAAPPRKRGLAPLRVLLAEDHPTNQRVVQLILATQQAQVVTVADGAQALEAFRADRFDVVLMDMQMPVMDGLTATRALRALEAQAGAAPTPIVMLSANAMAAHRVQALDAGADLHLPKPITAAGLLTGIETALGQ